MSRLVKCPQRSDRTESTTPEDASFLTDISRRTSLKGRSVTGGNVRFAFHECHTRIDWSRTDFPAISGKANTVPPQVGLDRGLRCLVDRVRPYFKSSWVYTSSRTFVHSHTPPASDEGVQRLVKQSSVWSSSPAFG
jgi:hypothetical protein